MCTVTFIPAKDKFYITSNRDEKLHRKQAISPKSYLHNNITLVYPKDADAGGSWIAMRNDGDAAVLLNGAFQKHISKPPYRRSRGNIFLDVITGDMPAEKFICIDLSSIEPFTLIIFQQNNLYECRWDGLKKYQKHLRSNKAHIWSSATLYDAEVVKKREQWFINWLKKQPSPAQNDILRFHQFTGDGDTHNDLLMNREGKMFTVSIAGIQLNSETGIMKYLDLKDKSMYVQQMPLIATKVSV